MAKATGVLNKGQKKKKASPQKGATTMNEEYMIEQQVMEMIGGRPKGHKKTNVINVYDNKYRVNIYVTYYDETYEIDKTKIGVSCFGKFVDDEFIVTYPSSGLAL